MVKNSFNVHILGLREHVPFKPCTNLTRISHNQNSRHQSFMLKNIKMLYNIFFTSIAQQKCHAEFAFLSTYIIYNSDIFCSFALSLTKKATTMDIINLSNSNSILHHFLAELRDVNIQNDPMRFRRNLERIGELIAYEISKTLTYRASDVTTPLGVANIPLMNTSIVLGTIFRAGLPMHQGMLNYFDRAENAFLSAYRYYKDKECKEVGIKIEYIASPDLTDKTLIIADPMLATGGSMELGYEAFCTKGTPSHTHMACIVASKAGVDYLERLYGNHSEITLWCAAIDPELNSHSYIIPGLGDAGDLAYGGKL